MIYTSFDNFYKVVDFWHKNRLPREIIIIDDKENLEKMNDFFKSVASTGVTSVTFNQTEIKCTHVSYCGYDFKFIDINDLPLEYPGEQNKNQHQ